MTYLPFGEMARKTFTDVPVLYIWSCWLSLNQKLAFNSCIVDRGMTNQNDSASYGAVCRIIFLLKKLIVSTSLKWKLNCKQQKPTQPSRIFNHLEIFSVICLKRMEEMLNRDHAYSFNLFLQKYLLIWLHRVFVMIHGIFRGGAQTL